MRKTPLYINEMRFRLRLPGFVTGKHLWHAGIFLAGALLIWLALFSDACASELLAGQVVRIDPARKTMVIRDMESGKDMTVAYDSGFEAARVQKGSNIRMWVKHGKAGSLKVERVCSGHGHDMTGIKKRLRKAAGFRRRGGRHGHGRGHGR